MHGFTCIQVCYCNFCRRVKEYKNSHWEQKMKNRIWHFWLHKTIKAVVIIFLSSQFPPRIKCCGFIEQSKQKYWLLKEEFCYLFLVFALLLVKQRLREGREYFHLLQVVPQQNTKQLLCCSTFAFIKSRCMMMLILC